MVLDRRYKGESDEGASQPPAQDCGDLAHSRQDNHRSKVGDGPACSSGWPTPVFHQAFEIASRASPRVRGPKPPMETTTISIEKAIKLNTAFTPPRLSR